MEKSKNASQLFNGGILSPSAGVDLTASRAKDTLYQNQTERPILLIIDAALVIGDAAAIAVAASLSLQIGEQASAIAEISKGNAAAGSVGAGNTHTQQQQIVCIIPPGYFYKAVSATTGTLSTVTTPHWLEIPL